MAVFELQKKAQIENIINKIFLYILLTLLAVFLVFPYFMMISRSFMDIQDINEARIFPTHWIFQNYVKLFKEHNYLHYLWNTMKILIFNIIVVPISSSICAYAFAKLRWKGRELVFGLVIATMMIPGTILQVPQYVMFSFLGWTESAYPLTIPGLFGGGAMNIFLLRQFMKNIPKEMDDAAKVDGAPTILRYLRITMPLCKPIILYIVVGTFSAVWSDFYGPLVYLTQPEKYTLAVAIYYDSLINAALNTSNLKMAAGVFMSILPAIVFLLYQRKLVDGIMIGGIKG